MVLHALVAQMEDIGIQHYKIANVIQGLIGMEQFA
jgi:hypothetical protein